jgi:tRNA nucleotidyltransferase (CCA-adding enzyme)
MNEPFKTPLNIIKQLEQQGHMAYFVGGAVRDFLLHRQIGDIDITTSAKPAEIMQIFKKTVDVGIEHGTIIVIYKEKHYEVTTFRSEATYVDFRRPSSVLFIDSLEEDLRRRDFTMNAIAMSATGELIDPFGGKSAILNGLIETVGEPSERFSEDALRMMRAIRFVGQLSFGLSKETKAAIIQYAHLLKHISIERITIEFEKILSGPNSKFAIKLLIETGLVTYLPGLSIHKDKLVLIRDYDWNKLDSIHESWSMLTFLLELDDIQSFLRSWKLPNKVIQTVVSIVDGLKEVVNHGWTKLLLFKLGNENSKSVEKLRSIMNGDDVESEVTKITSNYKLLPIKSRSELEINGKDLLAWYDMEPGPWLSDILNQVEQTVILGEIPNDKLQIKEWLEQCNLK